MYQDVDETKWKACPGHMAIETVAIFCHMTTGKHSSRIDIPSFQLHLEINLHKMADPGLNIPALKNESFTSRNMTETMYISF